MMLKVLFYAYLNNLYSCCKIGKVLQENIHFIGCPVVVLPISARSMISVANFKRIHKIVVFSHFSAVYKNPDMSVYKYIDGTKVELAFNRYTFVWCGCVEKNKAKLESKIQSILCGVDRHIEQDKQERTSDALPDMDSCGLREKVSALNKRLSGMNKAEQK